MRRHDTNSEAASTAKAVDPNPVDTSGPVRPSVGPSRKARSEYADLKRIVKRQGLLNKQLTYYAGVILLDMVMLASSLTFLVVVEDPWLQLLNAAYLAFVFTQIAFVVHDAGHRQIFRSARMNDVVGLFLSNLILGVSREWWVDKHNRHHGNPNDPDLDPDVDIPVLAFSGEQVRSKRGFPRFMVKYQAYFFFPLLLLEGFHLQIRSITFLVRRRVKRYLVVEGLLQVVHYGLYFGLLFYLLGIWQATLFIVVHQALLGLYLGSVFAPNHKGMDVPSRDGRTDFLRQQVLSSRNLKAHPLTDFLFGPLACQIEHHLFPAMPRNNHREAQKIVKSFCNDRRISYHETSVAQSYREILQHLHQVGVPLREQKLRR
jgi:fatty acid desaturase